MWKKQDLIKFLKQKATDLDQSSYDGLIALISCHGIGGKDEDGEEIIDSILTSDYGLISKTRIHRIFSKSGKNRNIPTMFIFDCCSGDKEREDLSWNSVPEESSSDEDEEKEVKKTGSIIEITEEKQHPHRMRRESTVKWKFNESNPDNKLILINSANPGFQSKLDTETGSYALTTIINKLRESLKNGNDKFLYKIMDETQQELHDKMKKQLITCTYNNHTRYVKFEIKKQHLGTRIELHSFSEVNDR